MQLAATSELLCILGRKHCRGSFGRAIARRRISSFDSGDRLVDRIVAESRIKAFGCYSESCIDRLRSLGCSAEEVERPLCVALDIAEQQGASRAAAVLRMSCLADAVVVVPAAARRARTATARMEAPEEVAPAEAVAAEAVAQPAAVRRLGL
jgi:hypothetical protein